MSSSAIVNEKLMNAVLAKDYDRVLECLQRYGAKANVPVPSNGKTAVGAACTVGNVEILQLLIQSCEDVNMFQGSTTASSPLGEMNAGHTPEGMNDLEWEDEFCDDDETESEDSLIYYYYAKTFERTGAIINTFNETQSVVSAQDPHQVDNVQRTPLHYAAARGRVNCVQLLLDHGAKVDAVDVENYTPLHSGAKYSEVTHLLIKHGANVNAKTLSNLETPLHVSIRKSCSAGARALIEAGANINEADDNMQTPLMYAVLNHMDSIALELIDKGAHVNIQDFQGWNALYYAILQNNLFVAERLLKANARVVTSHYLLHYCTRSNQLRMLKLLVDYGSSINVRDNFGLTPMLVAIQYRNDEILEYLFKTINVKCRETVFQPIERWDSELLFTVHSIRNLSEFRRILRVLFKYVKEKCFLVDARNLPSSGCLIPYCHTPLSRAIMQDKLNIAEYLLKEGLGVEQICGDHVSNHLRTICNAYIGLIFSKLLIHAGYKFPYISPPYPETWSEDRRTFEREIYELSTNPLSLQGLSRIAVRKLLVHKVINECDKYFGTYKDWTPLQLVLNDLEIPRILKKYLHRFHDCETVFGYYNDRHY